MSEYGVEGPPQEGGDKGPGSRNLTTLDRMPIKTYVDYIDQVADRDAVGLKQKDAEYGGSWKRRGGVGAFMMLARKWDRIEQQVGLHAYDVFEAVKTDRRGEGIIDDIRDLRRYLNLVEAHMIAEGHVVSEPR